MKPEPAHRPANIPTTAVWDEKQGEYCDVPLVDGARHGRARWFRTDGTLACESGYERGVEEGTYIRFHPDGSPSQEGTMHRDAIHGEVCWTRGPATSPESTVPPQCAATVYRARQVLEHGVPYPGRFFDADDSEVLPDGSPMPPRPDGVHPEAAYDPSDERWYFGLGSGGFEQRDGWWTWWTTEGTVVQRTHHIKGFATREVQHHDDGKRTSKLLQRSRHAFEVIVEPSEGRPDAIADTDLQTQQDQWLRGPQLREPGVPSGTWQWRRPDGTLARECDFEDGMVARNRTYDEEGRLVQSAHHDGSGNRLYTVAHDPATGAQVTMAGTPLPPRPDGVDTDARFDTQDEQWISGPGLEGGKARDGRWTWWKADGTLAKQVEYDGEVQTVERKFHDDGSLFVERLKDAQGRKTRTAFFYDDGDLNHSTDNTYDGEALVGVEIHKYRYGLRAKAKRVDQHMQWEWFDQHGKSQARGLVSEDQATGEWTFVDDGTTYTLDLSEHGLGANVDEDFDPLRLLGTVKAGEVAGVPEVLAGVDDIDWEDVPSCYGDTEEFARHLCALTSEVRAARSVALGELYDETLHQGTVYVATARVIPFIVRAMAHPNADVAALVEYVYDVASNAAPYREQALEWDEDDDDRVAVLGVVDAAREHFETIAKASEGGDEALTLKLLGLAEYGGEAGKAVLTRTLEQGPPRAQAIAAWSLLEFDDATTEDAATLLTHDHALVRCCAALAAARLQDAAPEGTVPALLEALAAASDLQPEFSELPFAELPLVVFLSLSLGNFPTPTARAAVGDLLAHEAKISWNNRPPFYRGLFALCFAQGEPPFAPDFLRVFETIASDTRLDGFVNFSEVARMWNLPTDFREYRGLVGSLEVADDRDAEMVRRFFDPEDE